jgi:hypothetical protein
MGETRSLRGVTENIEGMVINLEIVRLCSVIALETIDSTSVPLRSSSSRETAQEI